MSEMIRVLKSGGWLAIYDEPSTVFYSAKLMCQYGLQVEKKVMAMVIANKKKLGIKREFDGIG